MPFGPFVLGYLLRFGLSPVTQVGGVLFLDVDDVVQALDDRVSPMQIPP